MCMCVCVRKSTKSEVPLRKNLKLPVDETKRANFCKLLGSTHERVSAPNATQHLKNTTCPHLDIAEATGVHPRC